MRDSTRLGSGPQVQQKERGPTPSGASPIRAELRSLPYDQQVQRLEPDGAPPPAEPHHPSGSLDEVSVERWIQSALNLLLGSGLAIDGVLRGPTIPAVRSFQRKAPELAKSRLAVDGIPGKQTISALEKATDKQSPNVTEAQRKVSAPPEETSTGEAPGGVSPPPPAAAAAQEVDVVVGEQRVVSDLKAEIAKAATQKKSRNAVVVDVSAAYDQARQWTMAQHDTPTTDRAAETRGRLGRKWEELNAEYVDWVSRGKPVPASKFKKTVKDPGSKPDYIRAEWFKGYWSLWCYQFADKVASYMAGRKTSLPALVALTNKDVAAGGDGSLVKGRSTIHRGKTMAQMEESEKANPQIEPGGLVHVKLHHEGNTPYEFKDDFHHWVVWAGNGKFSDTLTGKDKSGASNDTSLRNWVKKSFKMKDYKFMHEDPRFSTGKNAKGEALPKANLQPLISAEYDTRQNPTQKEG